jgi:hypothetical protein
MNPAPFPACRCEELTQGDKGDSKARRKQLLSVTEEAAMQELKNAAVFAALWATRLQAFVSSKAAAALLGVRRDAAMAGPDTVQWAAAKVRVKV